MPRARQNARQRLPSSPPYQPQTRTLDLFALLLPPSYNRSSGKNTHTSPGSRRQRSHRFPSSNGFDFGCLTATRFSSQSQQTLPLASSKKDFQTESKVGARSTVLEGTLQMEAGPHVPWPSECSPSRLGKSPAAGQEGAWEALGGSQSPGSFLPTRAATRTGGGGVGMAAFSAAVLAGGPRGQEGRLAPGGGTESEGEGGPPPRWEALGLRGGPRGWR